jgi:entericidin A
MWQYPFFMAKPNRCKKPALCVTTPTPPDRPDKVSVRCTESLDHHIRHRSGCLPTNTGQLNIERNIMNTHAKKYVLLLALVTATLVSACNTVAGVGKDTQKAGEVIEDASGKDGKS